MGSALLIGAINAYHVCGGLLAVWAVTVTALGLRLKDFPRSSRQALLVGATSVVLVLATISSAIIEGAREADRENDEEAEAKPAAETAPGPAAQTIPLAADPSGQLRFDKSALGADAGPVTIAMKNVSPVPHDISIEGDGVDEHGKVVEDGGTSTVTGTLKPGSYTFYCSVPGHRQAGMQGTLNVR